MVIHNASFMMEREREGEFVEWIRERLGAQVLGAGLRPALSAMREAGGIDYRDAEAQTVAFQMEFDDIESARRWGRECFADLAAAFEKDFGPNAMVFTSLFERL